MLNYEFPPVGGGAANANRYLLEEFAGRSDLTVDLVTSSPDGYCEETFGDGVELYRLDVAKRDQHYWRTSEITRWTWGAYRKTKRLIDERQYDLCHSWFGWPSGLVAHQFRTKVPYLVGLRGSDIPGYNPRLELLDETILPGISRVVWDRAARVTVLSENSARMASRTLQRDFKVIPNGVDTDQFHPDGVAVDPPVDVLFVGRLIRRKGVRYLLEAIARLQARRTELPVRVTIVGSGNVGEELRARARALGIDGLVTFLGPRPHGALPEIYRSHDVFVLPSVNEALSNVVLEAIASGLAVITTDTGAAEMVDDNGYVVERESAAAIAEALARYCDDLALVEQHKRASSARRDELSWERFAERYLELYASTKDCPSRPAANPHQRETSLGSVIRDG